MYCLFYIWLYFSSLLCTFYQCLVIAFLSRNFFFMLILGVILTLSNVLYLLVPSTKIRWPSSTLSFICGIRVSHFSDHDHWYQWFLFVYHILLDFFSVVTCFKVRKVLASLLEEKEHKGFCFVFLATFHRN